MHQSRWWGPQHVGLSRTAGPARSVLFWTDNTLCTVWPSTAALKTEEAVPQKKYGVLQKLQHCKRSNFICVSNTVWTHKSLSQCERTRQSHAAQLGYLKPIERTDWEVFKACSQQPKVLKEHVKQHDRFHLQNTYTHQNTRFKKVNNYHVIFKH